MRTRLGLLVLGLASCVPSPRAARRPVDIELARRFGVEDLRVADPSAQSLIAERLARPLDKDAAIRIALANSPRLRAALAEIGIASSGLALGLGPITAELAARFDGGTDLELDAIQDLLGLITAPSRRAAGRSELAAAQATATATALRLAARVERAFNDLIAAQQELELRRTAFDAADAAAVVRERMYAAGNTPRLALARDRDAREQTRIDVARAEATIEARREMINALLGLTGDQTRWTATGRLPELPDAAPTLDGLEARAVAASLDLDAARARSDAAANQVVEQRLRSVVPSLGAGISVHREHDGGTTVGPAVAIGLPLLDWNGGGRARANAAQRRATYQLEATAIELRATARAARITALATYQEARHLREVLLPLRQQIVDETLKHYNAMDADPFALIGARRDLVDAGHHYVDAVRRYWNASAEVTAIERGVALEAPEEAGS
ncbi:MAG: TolC family protein, partial [Kofleriaceae bacterium]